MSSKILLLATLNQGKTLELRQALANCSQWKVKSLLDFPDVPAIAETGTTFEQNAVLKASEVSKFTGLHCLADDSGVEVEALNHQPGVFSARYAGEQATDADNNKKLLQQLEGIPYSKRSARFRCVLALAEPQVPNAKILKISEGVCEGKISETSQGKEGFGYDPLFIPKGFNKTFAELGLPIKKKLSHRAQALQEMILYLKHL